MPITNNSRDMRKRGDESCKRKRIHPSIHNSNSDNYSRNKRSNDGLLGSGTSSISSSISSISSSSKDALKQLKSPSEDQAQRFQGKLRNTISEDPPLSLTSSARDPQPTGNSQFVVGEISDHINLPMRNPSVASDLFVLQSGETEKHSYSQPVYPRVNSSPDPVIARTAQDTALNRSSIGSGSMTTSTTAVAATLPSLSQARHHHDMNPVEFIRSTDNHQHPQQQQLLNQFLPHPLHHIQQNQQHQQPAPFQHGYFASPMFYSNFLLNTASPSAPFTFLSANDPTRMFHPEYALQPQPYNHPYGIANGGIIARPPSFLDHSWNAQAYFTNAAAQNHASPASDVQDEEEEPAPVPSIAISHTDVTTTSDTPVRPDEQHLSSDPNSFPDDDEPSQQRSSNFQCEQVQPANSKASSSPSTAELIANRLIGQPPPSIENCASRCVVDEQSSTHSSTTAHGIANKEDDNETSSIQPEIPDHLSEEEGTGADFIDSMLPLGRSAAPLLPMPAEGRTKLTPHFSGRPYAPLASDEDNNWLSEVLCLVRCEFVEIFRATSNDVAARHNTKAMRLGQVGIRCRFCAHKQPSERAHRAIGFPSSLGRIYQSLSMMLRDHFGKCDSIPPKTMNTFLDLKSKTCQGATDSKNYWIYSAMKRGLLDSPNGILVNANHSAPLGPNALPYQGRSSARTLLDSGWHGIHQEINKPPILLVDPVVDGKLGVPQFLIVLMSQVQRVELEECERSGNRQSLSVGLAGLGCRYCCGQGRKGMCRLFPAERRTLANKVHDMWDHIRRCPLCPREVRTQLAHLHWEYDEHNQGKKRKLQPEEEDFLDAIWKRMGH